MMAKANPHPNQFREGVPMPAPICVPCCVEAVNLRCVSGNREAEITFRLDDTAENPVTITVLGYLDDAKAIIPECFAAAIEGERFELAKHWIYHAGEAWALRKGCLSWLCKRDAA